MVDGDPGADVWGMDVARYGDWTTLAYTNAKVRENYSRRFSIRFPNEELHRRAAAAHHADLRAAQGRACRVRRLLRARASALVRAERRRGRGRSQLPALQLSSACRRPSAARCARRVGLLEISNYGKFDVHGPGAAEWLCAHDGEPGARGRAASR